jgi:hypothetical protein
VIDVRSSTQYLLGGLGVLTALYVLSRTQAGALVVASATDVVLAGLPRGIRNNNPGNLEYLPAGRAWRGQIGSDGRFGIYDTASNGVRALGQQLLKYARGGVDSVLGLISTYAPDHENPTDVYVRNVAAAIGVAPTARIDVRAHLPALAAAIIRQENGTQPYTATDLRAWVYS